jgi:hypothetical protein
LSSADWSTFSGKVGGSGATGQVAYWNGTSSQTGSNTLTYTPTTSLLVNNSVTAASGFGRGINFTPTINASANSDLLIGLDIQPTFTPGIYTNTSPVGMRLYNPNTLSALDYGIQLRLQNTQTGQGNTDGFLISIDNSASANAFLFNYENASLIFGTNGTAKARLYQTGNLVLQNGGTFSDGGQRLQVQGDAFIKGSGATSATNALLVQDSSGNNLLRVLNNGFVRYGSNLNGPFISADGSNTGSLLFYTSGGSNATGAFVFRGDIAANTTGNNICLNISQAFSPSSGTANYSLFSISSTINQTGGANGITRGLYVNPTLTAAADWRSIEWSNNSGWGLYGAGTANNYLGGSLGIGSSISAWNTNYRLIQFPGGSLFSPVSTPNIYLAGNLYYDSSYTARYVTTGFGGVAGFDNGKFIFGNAASGTAGNAVTLPIQMTLTNAGRLLLGTTTESTFLLDVNGTARATSLTLSSWSLAVESASGSSALNIRTPASGRYFLLSRQDAATGTGNFQYAALSNGDSRFVFSSLDSFNGSPNASALVQMTSTTQGFLPPRMTNAQRTAISSPAVGLIVYCTDATEGLYVYKSTGWTFVI